MDVVAGTTFGAWTVIGVEGRAAWVKCRCQTIRLVALEALQTGESQSCGCMSLPGAGRPLRSSSFASGIADAEIAGGRKRQYGSGIK